MVCNVISNAGIPMHPTQEIMAQFGADVLQMVPEAQLDKANALSIPAKGKRSSDLTQSDFGEIRGIK